jgi:tetratricopeptide (TPR) repeat protein
MNFLQRALEALPAAAVNPLALIAYVITVAAWVWTWDRTGRLKLLLPQLDQIPKNQRAELISREMGVVPPPDPEQWMRDRKQRYFLIAFLALCFLILCLFGIAAWAAVRSNVQEVQRLRTQIDAAQAQLQKKLDEEKQQLVMAAEASGQARVVARFQPSSPEIKELAEKLKALVDQFKAEVGPKALSAADDRRIRLAEGTAANAEGLFQEALILVSEEDVARANVSAEAQIDQAVRANRVRADAFYGLHQWEKSLAYYDAMMKLNPKDSSAARGVGNCLCFLGRPSEALVRYDGLIARLEEQASREELSNDLADSLVGRGAARYGLGRRAEAIEDYDNAIAIYTRLVEQEGRKELSNNLACSLSDRGSALADLDRRAEAIKDFNKAIDIGTRLVEQEGRKELSNDLACGLNNRGSALADFGKSEEAIKDYDKAIAIYIRLVEQEGRKELSNDLAVSLYGRGLIFQKLDKTEEFRADLRKALSFATHRRLWLEIRTVMGPNRR